MFQIILTVISIALVAVTATATLTYVNPTLPVQKQAESRLLTGFESLHQAWDAYSEDNRTYTWVCDTFSTTEGTYEECEREIDDPGYLPVSGWDTTLVPSYLFLPSPPAGMNWSYGTNAEGYYFCAEGSANEHQLRGFERAEIKIPINQMILSDTCGDTTRLSDESLPLSNLKITYWLVRP